jgi:tetratricopeptide (TPR) repeat protein
LCHYRLKEYEKSLLITLEALRRHPQKPSEKAEIRSYLTNNYYELGRYREAVQEGEKTIKLAKRFPNDQIFYFRMALSYFKLGDMKNFAAYRELCLKYFREDNWNTYLAKLGTSATGAED